MKSENCQKKKENGEKARHFEICLLGFSFCPAGAGNFKRGTGGTRSEEISLGQGLDAPHERDFLSGWYVHMGSSDKKSPFASKALARQPPQTRIYSQRPQRPL